MCKMFRDLRFSTLNRCANKNEDRNLNITPVIVFKVANVLLNF